jgi:hypothetical protein
MLEHFVHQLQLGISDLYYLLDQACANLLLNAVDSAIVSYILARA